MSSIGKNTESNPSGIINLSSKNNIKVNNPLLHSTLLPTPAPLLLTPHHNTNDNENPESKPPIKSQLSPLKIAQPTDPPMSGTPATLPTMATVKKKKDDDFDLDSYYARLHAIPTFGIPQSENILKPTEEDLEDVDLNSSPMDSFATPGDSNQGITAELAQNFTQFQQVLPEVANAVFSSFSSILSLSKSPQKPQEYEQPQDVSSSHTETHPQEHFHVAQQETELNLPPAIPIPLIDTATQSKHPENAPNCFIPPPKAVTNQFRCGQKKKMYSHFPGLTIGETESKKDSQNFIPPNIQLPPLPQSDLSHNLQNSMPILPPAATVSSFQENVDFSSPPAFYNPGKFASGVTVDPSSSFPPTSLPPSQPNITFPPTSLPPSQPSIVFPNSKLNISSPPSLPSSQSNIPLSTTNLPPSHPDIPFLATSLAPVQSNIEFLDPKLNVTFPQTSLPPSQPNIPPPIHPSLPPSSEISSSIPFYSPNSIATNTATPPAMFTPPQQAPSPLLPPSAPPTLPPTASTGNQFRLSKKKPQYYSGPIIADSPNLPPAPIFAQEAPQQTSWNAHQLDSTPAGENKSGISFGFGKLNLGKLQSAVTTFFDPQYGNTKRETEKEQPQNEFVQTQGSLTNYFGSPAPNQEQPNVPEMYNPPSAFVPFSNPGQQNFTPVSNQVVYDPSTEIFTPSNNQPFKAVSYQESTGVPPLFYNPSLGAQVSSESAPPQFYNPPIQNVQFESAQPGLGVNQELSFFSTASVETVQQSFSPNAPLFYNPSIAQTVPISDHSGSLYEAKQELTAPLLYNPVSGLQSGPISKETTLIPDNSEDSQGFSHHFETVHQEFSSNIPLFYNPASGQAISQPEFAPEGTGFQNMGEGNSFTAPTSGHVILQSTVQQSFSPNVPLLFNPISQPELASEETELRNIKEGNPITASTSAQVIPQSTDLDTSYDFSSHFGTPQQNVPLFYNPVSGQAISQPDLSPQESGSVNIEEKCVPEVPQIYNPASEGATSNDTDKLTFNSPELFQDNSSHFETVQQSFTSNIPLIYNPTSEKAGILDKLEQDSSAGEESAATATELNHLVSEQAIPHVEEDSQDYNRSFGTTQQSFSPAAPQFYNPLSGQVIPDEPEQTVSENIQDIASTVPKFYNSAFGQSDQALIVDKQETSQDFITNVVTPPLFSPPHAFTDSQTIQQGFNPPVESPQRNEEAKLSPPSFYNLSSRGLTETHTQPIFHNLGSDQSVHDHVGHQYRRSVPELSQNVPEKAADVSGNFLSFFDNVAVVEPPSIFNSTSIDATIPATNASSPQIDDFVPVYSQLVDSNQIQPFTPKTVEEIKSSLISECITSFANMHIQSNVDSSRSSDGFSSTFELASSLASMTSVNITNDSSEGDVFKSSSPILLNPADAAANLATVQDSPPVVKPEADLRPPPLSINTGKVDPLSSVMMSPVEAVHKMSDASSNSFMTDYFNTSFSSCDREVQSTLMGKSDSVKDSEKEAFDNISVINPDNSSNLFVSATAQSAFDFFAQQAPIPVSNPNRDDDPFSSTPVTSQQAPGTLNLSSYFQ